MITPHAPTLVVDDFGINFEESGSLDAADIEALFVDAVRSKNRSSWLIGDSYRFLSELGEDFAQVLDETTISLHTCQNYAATARAFPRAWRRVPLSMAHYAAASALANANAPAALDLLTRAYDQQQGREFVRVEAAKLMGTFVETADLLLVYDATRQVFIPSGVPAWLPDGYAIEKTVRQS